jgi:hypothetical protein
LLQVVEWMQLLAERGTESAGFKSTGFERFERVWTGQQVGLYMRCWMLTMTSCWHFACAAAAGCSQQQWTPGKKAATDHLLSKPCISPVAGAVLMCEADVSAAADVLVLLLLMLFVRRSPADAVCAGKGRVGHARLVPSAHRLP